VVNPDGLSLIEENFVHTGKVLKKRKNKNPTAVVSTVTKQACAPEDAGVDLNRNYGVDWGIEDDANMNRRSSTEAGGACVDPCGECYKGVSAFSEKET
jgi:hypothetical protein